MCLYAWVGIDFDIFYTCTYCLGMGTWHVHVPVCMRIRSILWCNAFPRQFVRKLGNFVLGSLWHFTCIRSYMYNNMIPVFRNEQLCSLPSSVHSYTVCLFHRSTLDSWLLLRSERRTRCDVVKTWTEVETSGFFASDYWTSRSNSYTIINKDCRVFYYCTHTSVCIHKKLSSLIVYVWVRFLRQAFIFLINW